MFSALFNVKFLSSLCQLFLVHYFCFDFAAEFYFVVIIYRTILTLLCSIVFAAARVLLLEIMSRTVNTSSFGT